MIKEIMKNRKSPFLGLLILLIASFSFLGCDSEPDELQNYQAEPVLHAYLENDKTFGHIWLERVFTDIGNFYSPLDNGIDNAEIIIFPIRDDLNDLEITVTTADTVWYTVDDDTSGLYRTTSPNIVQPGYRYRIEVTIGTGDNAESMWAEETAPDNFEITDIECGYPDMMRFVDVVPDDPFNLPDSFQTFTVEDEIMTFTWEDAWPYVSYDDEPMVGYVLNYITYMDPDSAIISIDPDYDYDDEDNELIWDEIDRAGWTISPDYYTSIDVIWLFFDFVAPHRLDVIAGSRGYYKYMFAIIQGDQNPDQLPESNIQGTGFGCFGITESHSIFFNLALSTDN